MSYILEALKKSQEERELGTVPTLEGAPYLTEQSPARSTYWVIVAVVLALLAVLIALYAAFGARLLQDGNTRPGASLVAPTNTLEKVPPPMPAPGPPAEVRVPTAPTTVAKPVPKTAPVVAEQPAERPRRKPAPMRPAPKPAPAVTTPTADTELLPPLSLPYIPPDLVGEVQRFKQKIQKQDKAAEKHAEPPVPPQASEPAAPTEVPTPPEQTQTEPQDAKPPSVPETETTPEFYDLSPAEQAAIPPHRLLVHVYAPDPAQRFVILNSRKMREGGRTGKGLTVETITTEGVILEYAGKRFFVGR